MTRFLLSPALLLLGSHVLRTDAAAPYCLPGDACFPTDETLAEFNSTVGGRLIKAQPYGAACYAETYNADDCKLVLENKGKREWRASRPGEEETLCNTVDWGVV